MKLTSEHFAHTRVLTKNFNKLAAARCERAGELEEAGMYGEAVDALGELWRGAGVRPLTEGLDNVVAAEVLLRTGSLTGWIGSFKGLSEAQEHAKNFISEAASIFEDFGLRSKVAQARVDLAVCYWREGALDEARVVLEDALSRIAGQDIVQEARALLGLAMVERRAGRFNDALRTLQQAAPLFDEITSHGQKGRFFTQLGNVLENLGRTETRPDYIDRALVEYAAASYHVEQTGNLGFCGSVENNLGFLFYTLGRHAEAHEHLARAHRLFDAVGDVGARLSQVEDTRARVLLAEGNVDEAEASARSAVNRLEGGAEQSLLAEALVTHGTALARLEELGRAESVLRRAEEVAERSGDLERAGLAGLTLLEELGGNLPAEEARLVYERADDLLGRSQDAEVFLRLRRCARRLISPRRVDFAQVSPAEFVHASRETAELLRRAELIARAEGPVLIVGETGTGKEVLAGMIHRWSSRAGKFITIPCGGVDASLFEAKLFGGAATAMEQSSALLDAAGGTLFFDEVATLGPESQSTLLRLLEYLDRRPGEFLDFATPDVRVLASTNGDLDSLVAEGRFRGDLYYRLQKLQIVVPPLRERTEDIPALATHFIEGANSRLEKYVTFTPEAVRAMRLLPLHGNARELKSLIERTVLIAEAGAVITPEMVEAAALRRGTAKDLPRPWDGFSLKDEIHRIERRFIELALRDSDGMVSPAAKLLGFRHHESLASLLKSRHRELLSARTPARPRRSSIVRKVSA